MSMGTTPTGVDRRHLAVLAALVAVTAAAGVVAALPTAGLSVTPDPAEPGETVTLDASNSTGDGGVDRCDFDVDGDGIYEVSETDCVATWTYEERGTYNASVLVFAGDRTDTAARTVTVSDAPTATLSYDPAGPTVGETVSFAADASDPDGEVVAYRWFVDGALVAETANGTVEYAFESTGDHVVTVAVEDDAGHVVVREVSVAVEPTPTPTATNAPPTATVSHDPPEPTVGREVGFAVDAADPDGTVVNATWLVDGEAVAGGAEFAWTFRTAGAHEVTAVVTDDDGATTRATVTLDVAPGATATPGTPAAGWLPPAVPLPPADRMPLLLGGSLAVLGLGVGVVRLFGGRSGGDDGGATSGGGARAGAAGSATGATAGGAGGDAGGRTAGSRGGPTTEDAVDDAVEALVDDLEATLAAELSGRSPASVRRRLDESLDDRVERALRERSGRPIQRRLDEDIEERLRRELEKKAKERLKEELKRRLKERFADGDPVVAVTADGADPLRVSVDAGTTVRWVNEGDKRHEVAPVRVHGSAADWPFGASLAPGEAATRRFDDPGVYEFHCPDCGLMSVCGAVVVGDATLEDPLPPER